MMFGIAKKLNCGCLRIKIKVIRRYISSYLICPMIALSNLAPSVAPFSPPIQKLASKYFTTEKFVFHFRFIWPRSLWCWCAEWPTKQNFKFPFNKIWVQKFYLLHFANIVRIKNYFFINYLFFVNKQKIKLENICMKSTYSCSTCSSARFCSCCSHQRFLQNL